MAGLAWGSALPARASGHNSNGYQTPAADTITRQGYTLVFINRQPDFDTTTRQRMIDAFFTVYPKEANRFNSHTAKKVVFTIDPDYDGVAETGNDKVRFNPRWLTAHPEDIDVVTHEAMHIVQAYTHPVPGWLTEGIADYVRYVYGVNNQKGNWRLRVWRPLEAVVVRDPTQHGVLTIAFALVLALAESSPAEPSRRMLVDHQMVSPPVWCRPEAQ